MIDGEADTVIYGKEIKDHLRDDLFARRDVCLVSDYNQECQVEGEMIKPSCSLRDRLHISDHAALRDVNDFFAEQHVTTRGFCIKLSERTSNMRRMLWDELNKMDGRQGAGHAINLYIGGAVGTASVVQIFIAGRAWRIILALLVLR